MMKKLHEILSILKDHKPEWEQRFQLKSIAIFGSYARGNPQDNSDIDVVVDVDPSIGLDFVTLAEQIESILGVHTDVVSKRAVKPYYWKEIQKELIYV